MMRVRLSSHCAAMSLSLSLATWVGIRQGRRALGAVATQRSTDSFGLARKGIRALGAAIEVSALRFKVGHAHGWQGRCGVVLGLVVVRFVHGNRRVDNVWLDRFLVDDRLDAFMNMVMDMLASHDRSYGRGMLGRADFSRVFELRLLARETLLDMRIAAMVDILVLDADNIVRVLLGEDFAVVDGLHRGMVVVLVDFTVDGGGDIFVAGRCNVFLLDGGLDSLVHAGVVFAVLVEKGRDGGLCFLHDGWICQ